MIKHTTKGALFTIAHPFMTVNGMLYRYLLAPRKGTVKVHLGPGKDGHIDGWINVDANLFIGQVDVWADLRNPLPFWDGTVDAVYSHHVIEHLPDLERHFRDVFRCLKPGGMYRVGGPHGDHAITKFIEKDTRWFDDFPVKRKSIGGMLENFIFCKGEHVTLLTYSFLEELMTGAGFTNLRSCQPIQETTRPEIFGACLPKEFESDPSFTHTLIIEGVKP